MGYLFGGIDFDSYSIVPARQSDGNQALSGMFDMPARIGKAFHDWGDEDGIQPYVRSDEMRFGGRDIVLNVLMKADYENELLRKLYSFYDAVGGFGTIKTLQTDLGSFEVYLKDEIQAEYILQGWAKAKMIFRQPVVDLVSGTIPASDNNGYGIDNISFQTLGLTVLDIEGRHYLPATKPMQFTAYATEGYQLTKRTYREITLKCLLIKSSLNGFQTAIKSLYKLFSKEGLRTITYENDALRTFFVKDGFQVSDLNVLAGEVYAQISIKCVQVGTSDLDFDLDFLKTNMGVDILTNTNQKIIVDR